MNDIAVIHLVNGGFTVVDVDLFPDLSAFTWSRHPQGYACRTSPEHKTLLMHRVINDTPKGKYTDHRNRCKLDNTRRNLRVATPVQSVRNTGVKSNTSSGFKGVSWSSQHGGWGAQIKTEKKLVWLGYFKTAESAAAAYDEAAKKYFGEFAVLNNAIGNPSDKLARLRGVNHPCAKQTEDEVHDIRRRLAAGESQYSISKLYKINPRRTWEIAHRKTWAHVQ